MTFGIIKNDIKSKSKCLIDIVETADEAMDYLKGLVEGNPYTEGHCVCLEESHAYHIAHAYHVTLKNGVSHHQSVCKWEIIPVDEHEQAISKMKALGM